MNATGPLDFLFERIALSTKDDPYFIFFISLFIILFYAFIRFFGLEPDQQQSE